MSWLGDPIQIIKVKIKLSCAWNYFITQIIEAKVNLIKIKKWFQ